MRQLTTLNVPNSETSWPPKPAALMASLPEAVSGTRQLRFAIAELLVGSGCMAAMHCNREEFVSIAKPDCRFSHTLAVYLLRGLLFTKTLRLFVNRLRANTPKFGETDRGLKSSMLWWLMAIHDGPPAHVRATGPRSALLKRDGHRSWPAYQWCAVRPHSPR